MTAKELIERLNEVPEDAKILTRSRYDDAWPADLKIFRNKSTGETLVVVQCADFDEHYNYPPGEEI